MSKRRQRQQRIMSTMLVATIAWGDTKEEQRARWARRKGKKEER
jgi:hypothetical protein